MQTASLHLFRVPSPGVSLAAPIVVETFMILQLPTLLPDRYISSIVCNASPHSETQYTSPDAERTIPEMRPHHSSFNNAIIVFDIDFHSDIAPSQFCSFVLHRHALLSRINALSEIDVATPRTVPWDQWSPPTRWFNRCHEARLFLPVSYGQRYVQMPDPRHPTLRILDFNPYNVECPVHQGSLYKCTSTRLGIAWGEFFHPAHAVFAVDVWMSLPYAVHESFGTYDYDGFLMDEERVIGLHVSLLFEFQLIHYLTRLYPS
jgi:hypothetical protein